MNWEDPECDPNAAIRELQEVLDDHLTPEPFEPQDPKPLTEDRVCCSCGKIIGRKGDIHVVYGSCFSVKMDAPLTPEREENLKVQLGPFKQNVDYYTCVECWFRSMGMKPEGER